MLQLLGQVWYANPDLRLGQIIVNATDSSDPFYVEDDITEQGLKDMFKRSNDDRGSTRS